MRAPGSRMLSQGIRDQAIYFFSSRPRPRPFLMPLIVPLATPPATPSATLVASSVILVHKFVAKPPADSPRLQNALVLNGDDCTIEADSVPQVALREGHP